MPLTPVSRSVSTPTHGRFVLHLPDERSLPPAGLLVGFHGYAQNAEMLLPHLVSIPVRTPWLVCAVQGLHRFYSPRSGEVVASWMTSEDRDLMIADNVEYVRRVVEAAREACPAWANDRVVFLGFSQGAAMAYRAAAAMAGSCAGAIALCGDAPTELPGAAPTGFPPVLIGCGRQDRLYSEIRMADDASLLREIGVEATTCVFDGGHEWKRPFIVAAAEFLDGVAGAEDVPAPGLGS